MKNLLKNCNNDQLEKYTINCIKLDQKFGKKFKMSGFRIRKIGGDVSMGGTGIQKLHFYYLFPLLNFTIKSSSQEFDLYDIFRKIIEFILADKVLRSELTSFKELIGRFINGYIQLFDDTVTFKIHHLEHYPDAILEFGILANVSTLSSERTLQLLTRSVESSRNSLNLPVSIARAFSFKIESLFNMETITQINFSRIPSNHANLFKNIASQPQIFTILRSITCENKKVDKNCFYLVKICARDTNLPVFVKVLEIYYTKNQPYIIGQMYLARSYERKYHAYSAQMTDKLYCW